MATDDFDRQLRDELAEVERDVARCMIELVVEITANLREDTPVDTGHARANWVPSIGEPFEAEVGGEEAQAGGLARMMSYTSDQGDCYIANNVPYIGRLNDGYSNQAPAGFVEAAIARGEAAVRQRWEGR